MRKINFIFLFFAAGTLLFLSNACLCSKSEQNSHPAELPKNGLKVKLEYKPQKLSVAAALTILKPQNGVVVAYPQKGGERYATIIWDIAEPSTIYRFERQSELVYPLKGKIYHLTLSRELEGKELPHEGVSIKNPSGLDDWLVRPSEKLSLEEHPDFCPKGDKKSAGKCEIFSKLAVHSIVGEIATLKRDVTVDVGGAQPLLSMIFTNRLLSSGRELDLKTLDPDEKFSTAIKNLLESKGTEKKIAELLPFRFGIYWQMGRATLGYYESEVFSTGALKGAGNIVTPLVKGTSLKLKIYPEDALIFPVNEELLPQEEFKECVGVERAAICLTKEGELIRTIYKGGKTQTLAKGIERLIAPIADTTIASETFKMFEKIDIATQPEN